MIFAHDTEEALASMAALVNAPLPDTAALSAFTKTWGWTGRQQRTPTELRAVQALRPQLRRFWSLDEDATVELINKILRDGGALPQLVKHDGWDYHIHATPPDATHNFLRIVEGGMIVDHDNFHFVRAWVLNQDAGEGIFEKSGTVVGRNQDRPERTDRSRRDGRNDGPITFGSRHFCGRAARTAILSE